MTDVEMEKIGLRIPKQQLERLERRVEEGYYPSRSEAIRSAIRHEVSDLRLVDDTTARRVATDDSLDTGEAHNIGNGNGETYSQP